MNPIAQYVKLSQEFKHMLNRELTSNEIKFIKWMVHQELEKDNYKGSKSLTS
ncbi:hypothetical protein [Virgibacillus ihumii]|uniref:hypothetical protein n=1 Tax=Virgibacillus ihumii TaxID=2686091 RepID=UPI00157DDFC1|nr:hypothetical protein [Virgibacillus ihumii]